MWASFCKSVSLYNWQELFIRYYTEKCYFEISFNDNLLLFNTKYYTFYNTEEIKETTTLLNEFRGRIDDTILDYLLQRLRTDEFSKHFRYLRRDKVIVDLFQDKIVVLEYLKSKIPMNIYEEFYKLFNINVLKILENPSKILY